MYTLAPFYDYLASSDVCGAMIVRRIVMLHASGFEVIVIRTTLLNGEGDILVDLKRIGVLVLDDVLLTLRLERIIILIGGAAETVEHRLHPNVLGPGAVAAVASRTRGGALVGPVTPSGQFGESFTQQAVNDGDVGNVD